MNVDEYQSNALTYRLETATPIYALFNLAGEVGEVCSLVAKTIRDEDKTKEEFSLAMKKELGDVMWMLAAVAADYNLQLSDVCQHNLEKLEGRRKNNTIKGKGDDR